MHRITLETDNPKIIETLTWLAGRLGAKISSEIRKDKRKQLLEIIDKGGDISYIDDPISWQKKVRKDW